MEERLSELDFIRAGTALAVVAIHVTAGYMDTGLGYLANHLVRFAVPLFLVISGLVLWWNDRGNNGQFGPIFYRKRIRKILFPYLIWTLIYSVVNALLLRVQDWQAFIITLEQSLIWGSAYYHLYFITIILQMYLLYPLLRLWMNRHARSLFCISLLTTAASQVLHYLNLLGIITLPPQYAPLYLRAFPVWIFYFVFGMYAADQIAKKEWIKVRSAGIAWLGLLWLVGWGLVAGDSRWTGIYVSIVRPSVMLYTVSSFFFFLALAEALSKQLKESSAWLAAQSFLIYLMHPLLLTGLLITARKIGFPQLWNGNAGMIFLFLSVSVSTVFAAYLISLTPAADLLGGVQRQADTRQGS